MRPEDALQQSVCDYLDNALPRTSWYTAIPNGAVLAGDKAARGRQMAKLKRTGLKPGAPDLFVIHDGRFLGIELKAAAGKLSDAQERACDAIVRAGGGYTVARSVEAVEAFLRAHDVPVIVRLV